MKKIHNISINTIHPFQNKILSGDKNGVLGISSVNDLSSQ